ncbi:MAG: DUF2971 domain-containing protein [Sphaerochaetaceae bacterium]|nr:DUF2971 domain-containing protein [Sphaerochaetaceae bacterium]
MDRLYKYRPLFVPGPNAYPEIDRNTQKLFLHSEIFFNTPTNFPDSNDSNVGLDFASATESATEDWYKSGFLFSGESNEEIKKQTSMFIQNKERMQQNVTRETFMMVLFKVFSATDTSTDLLLWKEYGADQHGVCFGFKVFHDDSGEVYTLIDPESLHPEILEFDTPEPAKNLRDVQSKLPNEILRPYRITFQQISYSSAPYETQKIVDEKYEELLEAYNRKNKNFTFEKEWRSRLFVMQIGTPGTCCLQPGIVDEVVFGSLVSKEEIYKTFDFLSLNGKLNDYSYFQTVLDRDNNSLKRIPLDPKLCDLRFLV